MLRLIGELLAVDPSMCATAKNNFGCGLFSVCSFWLWTYRMQKWLWNLSGPLNLDVLAYCEYHSVNA